MTNTLAGGTVPAAVMNIGKNLARCSAAVSPARYPDTVACELKASMPWARLMRGSRSKLKTVAFLAARARTASSAWATPKKLNSAAPSGTAAASSALGGLTRTTNPAPASGRRGVGSHRGTGVGVGAVAERGLRAGAGLHADLPAGADELLDHVGDEGHTALSGTGLGGDRQFHGRSV